MYKELILSFVCVLLFSSCAKSIEDVEPSTEHVGSFNVSWRAGVNDEKKQVIRDILKDMQFVEGGTFIMGATLEQEPFARQNEKPAHYVTLSDFYICKNELSIEKLSTLLDKDFSEVEYYVGAPDFSIEDYEYVISLIKNLTGINFDLPTEAQWEYAARGGKQSVGHICPGSNTLGQNVPNELGIFNMELGKSELCKDAYYDYTNEPLSLDPCNMHGIGRVVRGGNNKSVEDTKNYHSSNNKFLHVYNDKRIGRVSARSYIENNQSKYLFNNILCRLVIDIEK